MESYNVPKDLISVPHCTLDIRDPNAMAVLIMLHSKPEGSTVSGKAVMDFLSIGRTRFYKARKILLDQNLITEIKKHNREGHFSGVEYGLVPHGTAYPKTTRRVPENDNAVDLARSVLLKTNTKTLGVGGRCNTNQLGVSGKLKPKQKGFRRDFEYPKNFLKVWNLFTPTLGNVGNKLEAFKQFDKLDLNDDDVDWLVDRIKNEIKRKTKLREAKEFDPNIQHDCRVLKNRAWESWPTTPTLQHETIL